MNKTLTRLFLLLTIFLLGSCTHNDGDIGELFGFWRLEEMQVNSTEVNLYADTDVQLYSFAFQSDIVLLQTVLPHNDYLRAFGSWKRDGSRLILNFDHSDNDDNTKYDVPEALGFNPSGVTDFEVLSLSGSAMTLRYTDSESTVRTYYFKKSR